MGNMAPKQKVRAGRVVVGYPNQGPLVLILSHPDAVQNVPKSGYLAIATDTEQGDISNTIIWKGRTQVAAPATNGLWTVGLNFVGSPSAPVQVSDPTGLAPDTAGGEGVDFGAAITAGSPSTPTNLPIGSPEVAYTASVDVDGPKQQISIMPSNAQTFADLIDELNTQTTGATWSIVGGDLYCTSDSKGGSSSIAIFNFGTGSPSAGALFSSIPSYVAIGSQTFGTSTTYTASVDVDGGGAQPISIVGENAQTYAQLLSELDTDTSGASWGIDGSSGNLECTSITTGAGSTVVVSDTDLFSALGAFDNIGSATDGTDELFEIISQLGVGASPTLTFPTTGVQNITAEAVDSFNITGSDTKSITVT